MKKTTVSTRTTAGDVAKTVGAGLALVGLCGLAAYGEYLDYDQDVENARIAMNELMGISNPYTYKVMYPYTYNALIQRCTDTWNKLDGAQQQKLIRKSGSTEAEGRARVERYLELIRNLKINDGRQYGRI